MQFLIKQDYYRLISSEQLDEVTRATDSLRKSTEEVAHEEIKGYLTLGYDLEHEFKDIAKFEYGTTYKAKQTVYLDATAYSASATYALNALVLYSGNVYYCKTAIGTPEAWNASKWTLLGAQYDLFYIPFPYTKFDLDSIYYIGDLIWYKDKIYRCKEDTQTRTHQAEIQANDINDLTPLNSFPTALNQTQWEKATSYSFNNLWPIAVSGDYTAWSGATTYAAGTKVSYNSTIYQSAVSSNLNVTPGTDITKWFPVSWTSGDARHPLLKQFMIDITLYHLHSGIAPRNIPELRVKRYDDAITYLEKVASGDQNMDIAGIQPDRGVNYFGGGEPKRINRW